MEMSSAAYASLDPTNLDNFKNPLHLPGDDGLMGVLDASNASVGFTAHKEEVEILPGKKAELLAFHAERDGKTYVNPTIRVQKGKELFAEFTNDLDEETTVHWHGLHVDWRMDGGMDHMEHMEMGHHHMDHHDYMDHHVSPTQLSDGSAFYLLKLVVTEKMDYSRSVPETLSTMPQLDLSGAASRPITVSMTTDDRGMQWLINGKTHEMDEFPIVVQRGAEEIWEIHNDEKSMPHPMHIHGFQFRVIERAGTPEQLAHLVVDEKGRLVTDLSFKDTVLIWPGETIKWFIDFSHDFEGEQLYMFHCHILEHETAMMLNLKVADSQG